jgi:DNA-binding transcriptional regulator YdaS (Cro superfamily)
MMDALKQWISGQRGRGLALARHLDVPSSFVVKMSQGEKPIPVAHGAAIERFTDGAVSRQLMFPTTWQRIWPELATSPTTEEA